MVEVFMATVLALILMTALLSLVFPRKPRYEVIEEEAHLSGEKTVRVRTVMRNGSILSREVWAVGSEGEQGRQGE